MNIPSPLVRAQAASGSGRPISGRLENIENRPHDHPLLVPDTDLFREAVFSYTVLSEWKDDEETKRMVSLVGDLVSRADFLPPADSDSG